MSNPIQSKTLKAIRQDIGIASGVLITGTATSTVDTTSLIDTYGLVMGASNAYAGRQVVIITPTGSIVAGSKSRVASSITQDATVSPAFSASITTGDIYEMWLLFEQAEINSEINRAISEVSGICLQLKQAIDIFALPNTYEYAITSFKGIYKVEYVKSIEIDHLLDNCEAAWTAGASVTATADTAFVKKGTYAAKFVVAAGAASGATLCYKDISSVDLSDSDKVEKWMYSSITLTAGQLQFMLDDTAACASALETIDTPAMTAGTWYRHSISLANRHLDTAIISIGVRQASGVDVGAFTFYIDDVHSVLDGSKVYQKLHSDYWSVVKSTTAPLLKLNVDGLGVAGTDTQLRVSGYQLPALLSADADVSEIDPAWLVDKVIGELLLNHYKSPQLTLTDRQGVGQMRLARAERNKSAISSAILSGVRWTS